MAPSKLEMKVITKKKRGLRAWGCRVLGLVTKRVDIYRLGLNFYRVDDQGNEHYIKTLKERQS